MPTLKRWNDTLQAYEYIQTTGQDVQGHINNTDVHFAKGDVDKVDVGLGNVTNELQETKADADAHKAEKASLTESAHVQTGVISLTLLSANWVGAEAPYTQTLTATGVTAGEVGTVDVDLSGVALYTDQKDIADAWGNVHRVEASANDEVTVYMNTEPTIDIPFTVKVVRG